MTPVKKRNFTQSQKEYFHDDFDAERTGVAVQRDRTVNLKNVHSEMKAVRDALDAVNYNNHDLPAHVRIEIMQRQIVRLRRSLVANVVVKMRLKRRLEKIEAVQDDLLTN